MQALFKRYFTLDVLIAIQRGDLTVIDLIQDHT